MASGVQGKREATVWYDRDSGTSQAYFNGDSASEPSDGEASSDEGASRPLVQGSEGYYLDVASAYKHPTGGPGTHSPRATSYYKSPGSGVDLTSGGYVPIRTSLYQFSIDAEKAEGKAYQKLTLKMHAFSNYTNEAITKLLPLLMALKKCDLATLNEKFRAILSSLAQTRMEEKGAAGEINLEPYEAERRGFYGRSFSGVEGEYYESVVTAVLGVLKTRKSLGEDEQVVVKYVPLELDKIKREESVLVIEQCHALFNKQFPAINALKTVVPAYERGLYAVLSYRIKAGYGEKSYKELFTRVIGLQKDRKGIGRFAALSQKEEVHRFFRDGACIQMVTKPPVLHAAPMTDEALDEAEGASLDFWIEEMARLCRAAMEWDPKSLDRELKDVVARLRFIFVHAAPFEKGNTVISEWLELAIYVALGFEEVSHKNDHQGALAALSAASFAQFRLGYDKLIALGCNKHREQKNI